MHFVSSRSDAKRRSTIARGKRRNYGRISFTADEITDILGALRTSVGLRMGRKITDKSSVITDRWHPCVTEFGPRFGQFGPFGPLLARASIRPKFGPRGPRARSGHISELVNVSCYFPQGAVPTAHAVFVQHQGSGMPSVRNYGRFVRKFFPHP